MKCKVTYRHKNVRLISYSCAFLKESVVCFEVYLGKRTLIARKSNIDIFIFGLDLSDSLKENSAVLCDYRNCLALTPDRHVAVKAFPVYFLPLVPAIEFIILADDYLIGCKITCLPDLAIESYQRKFAVIFVSNLAV